MIKCLTCNVEIDQVLVYWLLDLCCRLDLFLLHLPSWNLLSICKLFQPTNLQLLSSQDLSLVLIDGFRYLLMQKK